MTNDNKQVAIVLGGTSPHIHLIELLKARGFFVILIDYYERPPAYQSCHQHIRESTLDKEAVLKIAGDNNATLVISTCIDQANVTACYVSERLGLPHPYSYDTSLLVSDKVPMKQIMHENGIPTSKFVYLNSLDEVDDTGLDYPLIVKPSDSNSSKGVRKASNEEELRGYLEEALRISRNNKAIIEEFKSGLEIGLDCMIKDGEPHIILSRERRNIQGNKDTIQQIYGSFWPANISETAKNRFSQIAKDIAKAFDLDNTPLLIQAILGEENDEINVLEFAPRIGGGENHKIIELMTGYDIIDGSIDSFLGNDINLNYSDSSYIIADNYLYVEPGNFGKVVNYEEFVKDGLIEYIKIYKSPNSQIGADISSNNRVGALIVKGADTDEIHQKIKKIVSSIDILDTDGNSIMRKDIYNFNDE